MEEANWSEAVEDLLDAGDTDGAISLLETQVSKLQTLNSSNSALASALGDLATLYSSKGFSLKADDLRSRAQLLKLQPLSRYLSLSLSLASVWLLEKQTETSIAVSCFSDNQPNEDRISAPDVALPCDDSGHLGKPIKSTEDENPGNGSSDDDWEAMADRAPDELLSSQCLPGVSEPLMQDTKVQAPDTKVQAPKQRGRGTFSYKKHELYSDQLSDKSIINDAEDEDDACDNAEVKKDTRNSRYGKRHVLVLAGFPPSTRTIDLEKLFQDFKDQGFVIRWVNDTTALAVFRTPSVALEARNHIQYPFTVRILDEDDTLMSSISPRDLEPPRQRPQTSTRTAQRLIAQGMGLKLPSATVGSQEFRKQENERRNRIVTRQKLKDDAWGDDLN
ncbi:coiled-coil domain-containing protein r3hcc1l [Quercus suber]|uniref:Coiled-coil domain-containing protein r3hcc1l n=1 Tax=Quercus suber TaxID=58331 RepID=A0AAW0KP22_QUESU